MESGTLLPAGSAPPQWVEPRLFPGHAPLRIEVQPAYVSAVKQFHPTPQAPLNPDVYPRNGCNWVAAFSAIVTPPTGVSPSSRTAKSPITGGLERVSIQPVK